MSKPKKMQGMYTAIVNMEMNRRLPVTSSIRMLMGRWHTHGAERRGMWGGLFPLLNFKSFNFSSRSSRWRIARSELFDTHAYRTITEDLKAIFDENELRTCGVLPCTDTNVPCDVTTHRFPAGVVGPGPYRHGFPLPMCSREHPGRYKTRRE